MRLLKKARNPAVGRVSCVYGNLWIIGMVGDVDIQVSKTSVVITSVYKYLTFLNLKLYGIFTISN